MNERTSIGKLLKPHGIKGQLRVYIDPRYMDDLEDHIQAIFIAGLPYFIRSKDILGDEQAIIGLEDIDTRDAAQQLCNKSIEVPTELLSPEEADNADDWTGFRVEDKQLGLIGTVTGIEEMPHQVLLQVNHQGREVLIPLNEVLVPEVDEDKQLIITDLPADYLDVFLNPSE